MFNFVECEFEKQEWLLSDPSPRKAKNGMKIIKLNTIFLKNQILCI